MPGSRLAKLKASHGTRTDHTVRHDRNVSAHSEPDFPFSVALNFAVRERRNHARILTPGEVQRELDIAAGLPTAASRTAEPRFAQIPPGIFDELPREQGSMLRAALTEQLSHRNLAKRFRTTVGAVADELERGLTYVLERVR